jgi:hypothetical protein
MTIAATHGSRANRAGSFYEGTKDVRSGQPMPVGDEFIFQGISMPRGRSTFTKRQKEHTRQQRQRDKAERRNQRKQEKAVVGSVDDMAEMHEHAAEQAALFNVGAEDSSTVEESTRDHLGE